MFKDDARLDESVAAAAEISRRTVNRGMAWSVPVIVGAFAAPMASGSSSAQIGTPTVTFIKEGGKDLKHIDFTLTFSNSGSVQGKVEVLSVSSTGDGAYGSGLPQVLVVGANASVATSVVVWNYGSLPKAATYTFIYRVDGGTVQSVQIKA